MKDPSKERTFKGREEERERERERGGGRRGSSEEVLTLPFCPGGEGVGAKVLLLAKACR